MTNLNLEKLESKYGAVEYEGKKYVLTGQAQPTSRLLPYPKNYNEVEDGEEFDFEMSAPAVDVEGNKYTIYWVFTDIKGNEQDLDSFDYDNVNRVEES